MAGLRRLRATLAAILASLTWWKLMVSILSMDFSRSFSVYSICSVAMLLVCVCVRMCVRVRVCARAVPCVCVCVCVTSN